MSDRIAQLDAFRALHGWGDAECRVLAADASFRRYWRLTASNGDTRVLMDAPPPQEDVRPFVAIARLLTGMGLSAPRILAADEETGFLLLDDFGDATYTRLLAAGGDEAALYALAVDALSTLHQHQPPVTVPPYDEAVYLREAGLLPDWFLPAVGVTLDASARTAWDEAWRAVLPLADCVPKTLVLRDFHVDNLMLLKDRKGVAACGLLDFQDALIGPLTYDLMSLLEDARRDIDPTLIAAIKARYLAGRKDLKREDFDASWAVLAAQRHAKVIGIFVRLAKRDGKPIYLGHIPRVWRLLENAVTHPGLAPVAAWLDRYAPTEVRRRSLS